MLDCDVATGRHEGDAQVYQVVFPEGTKEFILCERHRAPLDKLRDADYGTWRRKGRGFKKVDLKEIQ